MDFLDLSLLFSILLCALATGFILKYAIVVKTLVVQKYFIVMPLRVENEVVFIIVNDVVSEKENFCH